MAKPVEIHKVQLNGEQISKIVPFTNIELVGYRYFVDGNVNWSSEQFADMQVQAMSSIYQRTKSPTSCRLVFDYMTDASIPREVIIVFSPDGTQIPGI